MGYSVVSRKKRIVKSSEEQLDGGRTLFSESHSAGRAKFWPSKWFTLFAAIAAAQLLPATLRAQELEPRAYANTPVGTNFFSVGYAWSNGNILLDPALPIEDLDADIHVGFAQISHTFSLGGDNAKFKFAIPWNAGDWEGELDGIPADQRERGVGDAWIGIDWLFSGAPALTLSEFPEYQAENVIGVGLKLSMPVGNYDEEELLNLGSNRLTLRSELAASRTLGQFTLEGIGGVHLFGDNDAFLEDKKLEQKPLWYTKGSVIYSFYKPGWWTAFSLAYGQGGRTVVDGVSRDNEQRNWRFGVALAFPLARRHGISLRFTTGINDGAGSDFDSLALIYTYQADSSD